MTEFDTVIGLEIHAQLATRSKLFCPCAVRFDAPPNSLVCERCLGMPGALPVVNRAAVELAVRAALALGCTVHPRSVWARKSYFYPDLSKGYQITQYQQPLATGGRLEIPFDRRDRGVEITSLHLEEDAGKSVHDHPAAGRSWVDFNRAGVPLIEIVTAPVLRSPAETIAALEALRQLLRYIEVCDGNMQEGSLRCDANLSLRPTGSPQLGTRTELKNLSSFRFLGAALTHEADRQAARLRSGREIVQETRLWDERRGCTEPLRSKEEAHDYRYFPEPDLPPLGVEQDLVDRIEVDLPELPGEKVARYIREIGLAEVEAGIIAEDAAVAQLFETALGRHPNPKGIANWVINELLRELKDRPVELLPFGGETLGALVALIDDGVISGRAAKEVFAELVRAGGSPAAIVAARGLAQLSDRGLLEPVIREVLAAHPEVVARYRAGKIGVIGYLVGQVMQRTGGAAEPELVRELLHAELDA